MRQVKTVDVSQKEESILLEAERITNGARQQDYGHPIFDFTCIADQMNALGFRRYDKSDMKELRLLKATDWPVCMECVKKSREWNSHKRDNPVDGAGYWNTLEMIYDYVRKFKDYFSEKVNSGFTKVT